MKGKGPVEICKVFYSWQSDLPNATNRGFIQKALENAAKAIREDDSIQVEPVIDRDTVGVPGIPDIAGTILAKIDQSQIFVCDVSITNQGAGLRPAPNPNVLIELGYALKTLGADQIIMVFNSAYGVPDQLPFDLRQKRLTIYEMSETHADRLAERKRLERILEDGLRTILTELEQRSTSERELNLFVTDQAVTAVQNAQHNQVFLVRNFMDWMIDKLDTLAPAFPGYPQEGEPDEALIGALEQSKPPLQEFARLAKAVAIADTYEAIQNVYQGFERILDRYDVPSDFSGTYTPTRMDYFKFVGHELFVILFSFLVREERWTSISALLDKSLYVKNRHGGAPGAESFDYISKYVELLDSRNKRLKLNRISLHADILNEHHTSGQLASLVPMQEFMEADFFLFLRRELGKKISHLNWHPWSVLYMRVPPRYLSKATYSTYAGQILRPLGLESVEALRAHIVECASSVNKFFGHYHSFDPLRGLDADMLGSM